METIVLNAPETVETIGAELVTGLIDYLNNVPAKPEKVKLTNAERFALLEAKENKTTNEFVRLANLHSKIESRTLSNVYAVVKKSPYRAQILGKAKMPDFNTFRAKINELHPDKVSFSEYQGFICLGKFNVSAQTIVKAAKQAKNTAKK